MKRNAILVIVAVIVIVLVGGGYFLLHRSSSPSSTNASTTSNQGTQSVNDAVLKTKTDPALGQYLADPTGRPLYTYGGDATGVSNCTGSCLANWPAYQDKGATTGLPDGVSTITRTDNGQVQFTYKGIPLYYFTGDSQGKVTGNGVENFHVVTPVTSAPSTPPSTLNSNTPSGYPY